LKKKKIEEAIRSIDRDSFTVLDFIEVFKRLYPTIWERLVEKFGLLAADEDTRSQRIFQTDSTFTRKSHIQFWLLLQDTSRASLGITGKQQMKRGKFSEALG